MPDFITLSCPNCGGQLQITNDLERFACAYCGTEHIVRRSGGIISLAPLVQEIGKLKGGIDKTASELAIKRLREEITKLEQDRICIMTRLSGETKSSTALRFRTIGAIVLAVIGLLFACVFAILIIMAVSTKSSDVGIFLVTGSIFVLPFIIIAASMWFKVKALKRLKEELSLELEPIEDKLNQMQAELKHHQKVVNI